MLLDAMAGAALSGNLIPLNGQAAYKSVLAGQVHWELERQVYDNQTLLLHIQHGHRWDEANLPRQENGRDLLAEGHILVESFLNGLHDINLSTFQPAWEQLRDVMAHKPAPHNIDIAALGRSMDNFDSELGSADYLRTVIGNHGGEVDALLRNTMSATFWQMQWSALSALTSVPIISDIGELFARIGYGLKRAFFIPTLRREGNNLLDGVYSGLWPTVPRVVVMGHSHIFDRDPVANPSPATRQYINSGTWVDVLQYDPANPSVPKRLSYERSVRCRIVPLPGPHNEVMIRENGSWRRQALIRLP